VKYVDVNVFVYWLGDDPVFGEAATSIVERIEKGERAATSSLTPWLTHIALVNARARNYSEEKLTGKFRELPFLRIKPLTIRDYEAAVIAMRRYRLDLEDSLHFTVAERLQIKEIYTNDKDFEKTPLKPAGFQPVRG
jgi:predicted nucleic acid-binding protein